jgi:hypothetical protein
MEAGKNWHTFISIGKKLDIRKNLIIYSTIIIIILQYEYIFIKFGFAIGFYRSS